MSLSVSIWRATWYGGGGSYAGGGLENLLALYSLAMMASDHVLVLDLGMAERLVMESRRALTVSRGLSWQQWHIPALTRERRLDNRQVSLRHPVDLKYFYVDTFES